MSINPEDVKLYESQRLTDEDDGGGRATGNVVIDGQINNLFNDISRLDRTLGDVSMRKAFVGIDTDNADLYLGAHAIIVEPPADPNVHVLLFDAGTENDERASAQQRIEAYVVQGSRAQWELLGNQYANQRQIVGVQRLEQPIPAAGDVFVLKNGVNEQYVRITEVEASSQTFAFVNGSTVTEFVRRRLELGISAPLPTTFPGGDPTPTGTTTPKSDVFRTEVADAARYWGVKRTTESADIGDFSVRVPSLYANLVPSAQTEQPLIDQPLGYSRRAVRAAAGANQTVSLTAEYVTSIRVRLFLPRAAVPGLVQLTLGGSAFADSGTGVLTRTSGSFAASSLTIDYETGTIEGNRDSGTATVGSTVSGTVTFRPGVAYSGRAETYATPVTLVNRGYNWNQTFAATKPRPGTMVISYMVLGSWYELRDPGNGVLEGEGAGTINFTTGTVSVSLLELPDVGSAIIYAFLMDIVEEVELHNGTIAEAIPEVEIQLQPGVSPESLVIEYLAGAVTKTVTDDGAGNLEGDGEGTIIYGTGQVRLKPLVIHDDGTDFDIEYSAVTPGSTTTSQTPIVGVITGTIPNAPLLPGSVLFAATAFRRPNTYDGISFPLRIQDNGVGGFIGRTGTINYATGAYSLEIAALYTKVRVTMVTSYTSGSGAWYDRPKTVYSTNREETQAREDIIGEVTITYQQASAVHDAETSTFSPNQLTMLLIDDTDDQLIPGSLWFDFAGQTYFDRSGILYLNFNSRTGAGQAVGTVNYTERTVTLETWTGGDGPGIVIRAAATAAATTMVSEISGRTPGAPLRPESFQISVTDSAGNIITDSANADGVLSTANLSGIINYQTGVYRLRFTANAADLTGASEVDVFPDTGIYNAVLYSFLPLDAELIGLDPVRLPSDGRVPIFREGDVIVIAHTTETVIGTPTNGQLVTLARDHQAHIDVIDSDGLLLDPAQYTVDLLAGTVQFNNPVVLETAEDVALDTPLTVRDRVEHMSVINDVQINGTITFIAPLPHEFPAEETIVSSALVWGDINSRVFNFFKQQTWSSGSPNWGSDRIGNDTTAAYNDVDYPIEYANNGAITEKWALVFTSSTAFTIVGQTLGIIGTGNTSTNVAPLNPMTGNPYFIMRSAGFGGGWASGNAIRFDMEGCLAPLWVCRTVLSGQAQVADDRFVLQIRGDAD